MTVISGVVTELTSLSIRSFTMWWFSNWKSIFTLVRIQRLVCVSTGIFAFRIDMEPLTRVCTPACGQPNGGRAGAPSGYTLVLSTSNPLQQNFLLPQSSKYERLSYIWLYGNKPLTSQMSKQMTAYWSTIGHFTRATTILSYHIAPWDHSQSSA